MQFEKEECQNASDVLQEAIDAIRSNDSLKLKELSNRTTHSSCSYQDAGSITTAILIYALSKIIERGDDKKIKNWNKSMQKIISFFKLAIDALQKNNSDAYSTYMQEARKTLASLSSAFKEYMQDVLRKSAINKGSKMYEHGISLEQTSKLLGISQWELASYTGQRQIKEEKQNATISVKKRAQMAMEFLS